MAPKTVMQGTGQEIAEYASAHPSERFELSALPTERAAMFDRKKYEEALALIAVYSRDYPVLPPEAFTTESYYE